MTTSRPRLFIGSSTEALPIARAVQSELEYDLDCDVWTQGLFRAGETPLESLLREAPEFDFALLVVEASDVAVVRGETVPVPRDNLLFELGLFMAILGRGRTFLLFNRDRPPKLPSDLAGVIPLTYSERQPRKWQAEVGPACTQIRAAAAELKQRNRPPAVSPALPVLPQEPSAVEEDDQSAHDRCIPGKKEEADLVERLDRNHHLDPSPLFVALLDVHATHLCTEVRNSLLNKPDLGPAVEVEAVYDVFGPYDLLVKLRAPNVQYDVVQERLTRFLGAKSEPVLVDVRRELYKLSRLTSHPGRRRSIVAFVHIKNLDNDAQVERAFERINSVRARGPAALLTGAYLSRKELIAEFHLACGGYYDLAEVVFALEVALQGVSRRPDRVSLLAMAAWEPD